MFLVTSDLTFSHTMTQSHRMTTIQTFRKKLMEYFCKQKKSETFIYASDFSYCVVCVYEYRFVQSELNIDLKPIGVFTNV